MGISCSKNGNITSPQSVLRIAEYAPNYINAAQCVFNRSELAQLAIFFRLVNSFLFNSRQDSLVNKLGGASNIISLSTVNFVDNATVQTMFAGLVSGISSIDSNINNYPRIIQSQLAAFAILMRMLLNVTYNPSAFSSFALQGVISSNALNFYNNITLNDNPSALTFFLSSLDKICFANNTNVTCGKNTLIFVSSNTVLLQGVIQEVLLDDCTNDSSLGPCISGIGAGLEISSGVFVSTQDTQVVLVSPANTASILNTILQAIGTPQPFTSSTINSNFLLSKNMAEQDGFITFGDFNDSSSYSESISSSSSESISGEIQEDFTVAQGFMDHYIPVTSNACSSARCSGVRTKGKETKGKETKGKETKGKETKGKETKGKDKNNNETKSRLIQAKVYSSKLYGGSLIQYLRSLQGAVRVLSYKMNRLLEQNCQEEKQLMMENNPPVFPLPCEAPPEIKKKKKTIFETGVSVCD